MNTPEAVESIISALHDAACDGDVAEVLVLLRDHAGQWQLGYASDDVAGLVDAAQEALAGIDGKHQTRRVLQ